MPAWSTAGWTALAATTFVLAASGTWLGIVYARRRRLLDHPGQRRSHRIPTPRGGGIGMVAGLLFAVGAAAAPADPAVRIVALAVLGAIVIVAGVGWIDDHRGLRAWMRLVAHGLAAAVVLAAPAVLFGSFDSPARPGTLLMYSLAAAFPAVAIVWSINLHNFMDGIDGLAALQAVFVLVALALLFRHAGYRNEAGCMALFATAVAGFVPFNFPRARVFMGDVGSGVLGLVIALAVLWQMTLPAIATASGLVLCCAFATDATCTLLSRLWRGRRWYSAHREHLYQWLVRCGWSHARVVASYMGWNLLIVLPVVVWMNQLPAGADAQRWLACGGAYAAAAGVWWVGKRLCLRAARAGGSHAPA